ncbi:hypothetical protein CYMTET_26604, partial [Cymbomonas tetramitiformis]
VAVEVGTMAGYSAILIAQTLRDSTCKLYTLEADWKWVLVAKRFLWMCNQGERGDGEERVGERVKVQWGDALQTIPKLSTSNGGKIETASVDFLLIDGQPKDYLGYLKAAEPLLAPGAVVVAATAGVFKDSVAEYLDYVRNGGDQGQYASSRYLDAKFGWYDEVADGMEVSVYQPLK